MTGATFIDDSEEVLGVLPGAGWFVLLVGGDMDGESWYEPSQ